MSVPLISDFLEAAYQDVTAMRLPNFQAVLLLFFCFPLCEAMSFGFGKRAKGRFSQGGHGIRLTPDRHYPTSGSGQS